MMSTPYARLPMSLVASARLVESCADWLFSASAARAERVVQARQAPDLMDAPGELGRRGVASARRLQRQVPVVGQREPRSEPVDVVIVERHLQPLVLLDVGVADGECLHDLPLVDERLVAGRSLESEVVDVGHRWRLRLAPRRERDLTHRAVAGDQVRPQEGHVGAGRQGDGRPRTRGRTQPDEPVTAGDAPGSRCVGTTDPVGDRVRSRASPSRQRLVAQLHPDLEERVRPHGLGEHVDHDRLPRQRAPEVLAAPCRVGGRPDRGQRCPRARGVEAQAGGPHRVGGGVAGAGDRGVRRCERSRTADVPRELAVQGLGFGESGEMHHLAVPVAGHPPVVVGPPEHIDVVQLCLVGLGEHGGVAFAERGVDVHRHADGTRHLLRPRGPLEHGEVHHAQRTRRSDAGGALQERTSRDRGQPGAPSCGSLRGGSLDTDHIGVSPDNATREDGRGSWMNERTRGSTSA